MVNIWQVYFDEATRQACDPAWNHYDNSKKLNEFFENQVIANLIEKGEHLKDEYFGVFSHDVKGCVLMKGLDHLRLTPESMNASIEKYKVDVFGFCMRRESQNIVMQAERWHKGFVKMMKKILDHCGMELPYKLNKIILWNLMVCKGEFWTAYYYDLLKPAMEILKQMPEAYEDSQYALVGKKDLNDGRGERFMKGFGKSYYPFHPFLCERLASIYLQLHPEYSFKQIF